MRYLFFLLIITVLVGGCSSSSEEECDANPGCAPPGSLIFEVDFTLINTNNEVLELESADHIVLEARGIQENLTLISEDRIKTWLTALNLNDEPETTSFTLQTPFGETQEVMFVISSVWADECQWCKHYFISEVIQNQQDTLFTGELSDQLIAIKIN